MPDRRPFAVDQLRGRFASEIARAVGLHSITPAAYRLADDLLTMIPCGYFGMQGGTHDYCAWGGESDPSSSGLGSLHDPTEDGPK